MPGSIHDSVKSFFRSNQRENEIIKPFLAAGFDVTWANIRAYERTTISVVFLRPSNGLADSYGFEYEIILAYAKYESLEPRTIRAIEHVFTSDPAKGRVEPLLCFLVSEAEDVDAWVTSYLLENKESRIVVPFSATTLTSGKADEWAIKNQIQKHFLLLDRYNYTSPLKEETYFFGRSNELGQIIDFCRRSENAAVFGLRKTGKTSILYKLKRILEKDTRHKVYLFDAQSPSFRKRRWNQALQYILKKITENTHIDITRTFDELDAADDFVDSLKDSVKQLALERITIVIDEIEWITPGTTANKHWESDFLEFWQAIRTSQAQFPKFNIVLAGVSPAIAEESRFGEYQNPLFGIVTPIFLRGMTKSEISDLVEKIGKVVGIGFDPAALDYLYEQYSGHPLLTRLACSHTAQMAKANNEAFPLKVLRGRLEKQQALRDGELIFYVRHVVDELERFYPAEYKYLECLAVGEYQEFQRAAKQSQACAHLFRYGVVSAPDHPYITYSVLSEYVAIENARRDGRPWKMRLTPESEREIFLEIRLKAIAEDMRELERLARTHNMDALFGPNSFPEADHLRDIKVVNNAQTFASALNILNRCFVESIDRYGNSISKTKYFFSEIKNSYPALQQALRRVRVYRNNEHHLELIPGVEATLREFLSLDLDEALAASDQKFWGLFQRVLDELILAIQREISTLSST
ncbi:TPA: ATP-binding protein [Pseudomonas aeruginosa]|uniref:ATP-binding protein n=1 Tax=Pseudomonas aeruginosa TaxID=287 RepID=UPI001A2B4478|nr:ATP-binding protein [Pseudomonas aeruginosa]MBH3701989.1 ATP-binding protein [Pseudomonas aeruginosa]MBI7061249.1 ATP-binding protein [Pseudomonas aeruginosa]MBI8621589.1 ATP-binding protein [Pseudomonas aeruginosa]HCF7518773.1 ATP-binding protein [Pseudomonas aeruginosa]